MRRSVIIAAPLLALATACAVPEDPTAVQPAESGKASGKAAASKPVPVKLTAKGATAAKSALSTGGALSCAKVAVANQTKKNLEVNPLYFSITDSTGTKHDLTDALGEYEGQINTTTLAPGEKATGVVCGKGKWTPKVVAMTNPLFSEAARAEVG